MRNVTAFLCVLLAAGGAAADQKPADAHKDTYTYSADRFVDPFVPIIGAGSVAATPGSTGFDPAGAQVGGILSTAKGAIAVLKIMTGGTYFVRQGHIFDTSGHTVPKYLARITSDSVIVWATTGTDRFVFPLHAPLNEDPE